MIILFDYEAFCEDNSFEELSEDPYKNNKIPLIIHDSSQPPGKKFRLATLAEETVEEKFSQKSPSLSFYSNPENAPADDPLTKIANSLKKIQSDTLDAVSEFTYETLHEEVLKLPKEEIIQIKKDIDNYLRSIQ